MNDETTNPEDDEAGAGNEAASEATETPDAIEPEAAVEIDFEAELADAKRGLAYAMAEAENARKRADKEIADARVYSVQRFASDLLSVADNFARALQSITPEMKASMGEAGVTLLTGVEMTEKELHAVLARHGVTSIPAMPGDKFDPNLHQAAAQIPAPQDAGAIASVIQTGWQIAERTLRPAMVAVSSGPPPAEAAETPAEPVQESGNSDTPPEPGSTVDTSA